VAHVGAVELKRQLNARIRELELVEERDVARIHALQANEQHLTLELANALRVKTTNEKRLACLRRILDVAEEGLEVVEGLFK
jgi:hypothetical protein